MMLVDVRWTWGEELRFKYVHTKLESKFLTDQDQ